MPSERQDDLAESPATLKVLEGGTELRDGKCPIYRGMDLVPFQRTRERVEIASTSSRCDPNGHGVPDCLEDVEPRIFASGVADHMDDAPGLYLYFPSRSQAQPKLRAFIDFVTANHRR